MRTNGAMMRTNGNPQGREKRQTTTLKIPMTFKTSYLKYYHLQL